MRELIGRVSGRVDNERFMLRVRRLVPEILKNLPALEETAALDALGGWTTLGVRRTLTGVAVITIGYRGRPPSLVIMLPQTTGGLRRLRRHSEVAAALRADPRLRTWSELVPRPISEGRFAGQYYFVSQALPGTSALSLLSDPVARPQLLARATQTVMELHQRTARATTVAPALLERWIDLPALAIRRVLEARDYGRAPLLLLDNLQARLHASLAGREVKIGWIHGDFWPGNLLVNVNGAISGIVDWDRAACNELPEHDTLHLAIYTSKLLQRVEPGVVIRSALENPESPAVLAALGTRQEGASVGVSAEIMLLLYWLRFIAASLAQSAYFATNRSWVAQNIMDVLNVGLTSTRG
jgi:hypothetical protein